MLKLGSSKPWPEALEMVTGQNYMDASALLDYYKPLHDWLREENAKAEEPIGWKETGALANELNQSCIFNRIIDELSHFFLSR